eukprot:TRINITY_DN10754_c0_g2_i4.p1 TRINITY_DN10754_c0_g2~~TRINITY_DN10754_c0_g2_i4.p1  ORF type:complete len:621 (-),score=152.66 TRINITY_DN10754_c0_g2_i4:70-1932(-)
MGAEESEVGEEELEALKKELNDKAEQRLQMSLKETEPSHKTLVESAGIRKQAEGQMTQLNNPMNSQKTMESEIESMKKRHYMELNKLREEIGQKESLIIKYKDLLFKCNQEILQNKSTLKAFIELIKDGVKLSEETSLNDKELLIKYQLIFNYGSRILSKTNLHKIDELATSFNTLLEQPTEMHKAKKYEDQIRKIKSENEVLSSQTIELEKCIGSIYQADACQGSEDYLSLRRERDLLKTKVEELETRFREQVDESGNVERLAQILAYLPKRRVKLRLELGDDKRVAEPKNESEKLNIQKEEEYVKKIRELENKINELLNKLTIAAKDKGLNEKLKEEHTRSIKLKDEKISELDNEVQKLNADLIEAKAQTEKLTQDARKRDLTFAQQMTEVKGIFHEMRSEKERKQQELNTQQSLINSLKQHITELNTKLTQADNVVATLKNENEDLLKETERLKLTSSSNEFKAMVTLANIILARSKNASSLSPKEVEMIKYLFNGNIRELLEEIDNLQKELKVLGEEVREIIASKGVIATISSLIEKLPISKEREELATWLKNNSRINKKLIKLLDNEIDIEKFLSREDSPYSSSSPMSAVIIGSVKSNGQTVENTETEASTINPK